LFEGIARELKQVDRTIERAVEADEETLSSIADYVVSSGGKRVRPALVLLAFLAANGEKIRHVIPAAAAIEVIHTATLIHDDISDHSEKRRGKPSAHVSFGVARSLIAADYLMTAAFKLVGDYGVEALRTINTACMSMAIGEIQDLRRSADTSITEEEYLEIVERKTGALFEAGVRLGVMLAGADPKQVRAFGAYGRHVGTAFQIVDDVLDVSRDAKALGKPVGKDLREGKVTVTSIYALQHLQGAERKHLVAVLTNSQRTPSAPDVARAMESVRATGAEPYGRALAKVHSERAKRALKGVPKSKALLELTKFADDVVDRRS